jgi:hypothetical protein
MPKRVFTLFPGDTPPEEIFQAIQEMVKKAELERQKSDVVRPKRFSRTELAKVGVEIMGPVRLLQRLEDPECLRPGHQRLKYIVSDDPFWLRCQACGTTWTPTIKKNEPDGTWRMPPGYWRCPNGCNTGEEESEER